MPATSTALPKFKVEIEGKEYIATVDQVVNFTLGREDHGIFTDMVAFQSQSMPGIALDYFDRKLGRHVSSQFAAEWIIALVDKLGSPQYAKGTPVVVFREEEFGLIKGFAVLDGKGGYDKPLIFEDFRRERLGDN